jgi:signal transduction histidine kinase
VSRRSQAFDIAVAALVLVLGQLEAWWGIGATHRQGPLWAQSLVYTVAALLLVFRRRRPFLVLVVMVAAYLVEFAVFGASEGYAVALAPLVAVYTVGRYVEPPRAVLGLVLGAALGVGWVTFDPLNESWADRLGASVWMSLWVIGWLAGVAMRLRAMYLAQRGEAAQQRTSRAVAEERNRISRELHDVIGHSLSVMTVQTSAVRLRLAADQVVEREALETVESVGREALAEMRRIVGVLRETEDDGAPTRQPRPGLAQVEGLADKVRAAGLPVSVTMTGPERDVPPGLDLTAYRIVQEGLTNALRHARSARSAQVEIAYGQRTLELAVRDDGAGTPADDGVVADGEGSGLLGMRERVAVYGGSLVARHRADGGFELLVSLPLEAT